MFKQKVTQTGLKDGLNFQGIEGRFPTDTSDIACPPLIWKKQLAGQACFKVSPGTARLKVVRHILLGYHVASSPICSAS